MGFTGFALVLSLAAQAQVDVFELTEEEAANRVAVPPATGPRTRLRSISSKAFQEGLSARAIVVVTGAELVAAAKNVESSVRSEFAAMEAGCGYLVRLRLERTRRGPRLRAVVVHAESSERVGAVARRFGKRRRATRQQAAVAGAELAKTVSDLIMQDRDQRFPPEADLVASSALSEPSDPPAESVRPLGLQIAAGVGSRVGTSYVLSAQNQSSLLSYELDPLWTAEGAVRFAPAFAPIRLALEGGFAPIQFAVGSDPLFGEAPFGLFGWGALTGQVVLTLFKEGKTTFTVAPLVGGSFDTLDVDSPAVVGWTAWTVLTGLEFGFAHEDVEGFVRATGGAVLDYTESTSGATGEPGLGFRFGGQAEFRWWISRRVGVALKLRYEQWNQDFDGQGSRLPFNSDPELNNVKANLQVTDVLLSAIFLFDVG